MKKMPLVILGALIFVVFGPCLCAGFLNWDDPAHLLDNPLLPVRSFSDVAAIFATPDSANRTYIPLTIFSFALERHFAGLSPFIFHLNNVLLHFIAAILVRSLALRMGLSEKGALFAALVFALHPMRVESVAWVTERKDVLFGAFYLGALVLYWDHVKTGRRGFYVAALVCAVASVLAKPMAFSIPFIFFLLDRMAHRPWTRVAWLDKVPFMLALWPVAMMSVAMQARATAWMSVEAFLVAAYTATFYVVTFFFPFGLSTIYPVARPVGWGTPEYAWGVVALTLIMAAVWFFRRERWVVFAFWFYTLSMFILWRVDLFEGAKGIVNERFMYIPCVGFALLLGKLFDRWACGAEWRRRFSWAAAGIVIAVLAGVTFGRCFVWQDSLTFWNDVLRRDPVNTFALINRSECLLKDEKLVRRYRIPDEARYRIVLHDLRLAVRRAPTDADAWRNLGIAFHRVGDKAKAKKAWDKADQLDRSAY